MTVIAAVILLFVGLAHSYLGERYILTRLFRRTDLPPLFGSDAFTRHTLRFAWHITTLTWWGLAVLLIQLEEGVAHGILGRTIAVTALGCGIVAFVGSRGRHLAWLAFLAVALLAWFGTRA